MLITYLEPKVSRAQAARILNHPARRVWRGRLEVIMDFYVPYHLFAVRVSNADRGNESFFAVDTTTGALDLYSFADGLAGQPRSVMETERVAAAVLGESESFSILREKIKRREYLKGFFRLAGLEVSGRCIDSLHLPYWVGVYRRNDRAAIEVLDALRGTLEGAKLREIISGWFHSRLPRR